MATEPAKLRSVHESQDENLEAANAHHDAHIAIHTDTYDIDADALGTNLPKHYYRSFGFIGTVIVRSPSPLPFTLLLHSRISHQTHNLRPSVSATSATT